MNKKSQNFRLRQDFMKTISNEDGLFEFTDLDADTYYYRIKEGL